MKVLVTGATGFVGTAVVSELLSAGHQVLGLARSPQSEQKLEARGVEALRGDLQDLSVLKKGAEAVDGIIHTGFIHDFSNFAASCKVDYEAIQTMGSVLKGSARPLFVTSGTALVKPGQLAKEQDRSPVLPGWPRASEQAAEELMQQGVRASVVRLAPSVHGDGDHGFVSFLIQAAREKGVSAYLEEGKNRWNAVHRFDAANLYRKALEKNGPGAFYHAVAEESVDFKSIAEVIGAKLNLPVVRKSKEEGAEHFGWFAHFAGIDAPASSEWTRRALGWNPTQVGLIEDIANGKYFE